MAPTAQPPVGQRKISNFFKPKPDAKPHVSSLEGSPRKDEEPSSNKSAADAEPPRKRLRLSRPGAEVITLDDDSDAREETPHSPAQPEAAPSETGDGGPVDHSSRATSIPARHSGRHMRFQQKLARPSTKEPAAGDAPPKQPFTPLELQIVDLKRRHPGVLLVIEVRIVLRPAARQRSPSCSIEGCVCIAAEKEPSAGKSLNMRMVLRAFRSGTNFASSATMRQSRRRSATSSAIRTATS